MRTHKLLKPTGLVLAVLCLTTIPSSAASATTVKLDLNGVAPVVHQVDSSGSVTVPEVKVEFDNMSFKGWNISPTGNGKSYDAGDTIGSNTTLYAQWADGTHIGGGTVDPDPGGGEEPGGGEDPDPDPGEDEEYAQLSDLNVITVTVDGKLLSSFNPLTNGTYTVPSGSNIRLNLNNLNLNVWSYTQSQPSSNTLTFTMTGKTQSGNLVVTYTFKAEAGEPDPDPDPDPNPNPGGDEGEDPNPTPDPNPDDGNQDEGDKPGQDTNPDSDNDPNHDSNPAPGTITGDVSGGSNNGSNGTGNTGRQDTALNPGSPTAGFINLTTLSNIETAAPLAAIASGTLAVLAVLLLTNKEAKKVKQASSKRHNNKATKVKAFFTTLTHNKAHLTIASISALAILAGSFYLINTNTNAATDTDSEDWGIYVDDEGVPYEGFFTIMPEEGATDYSTAITTWWKGGQKQYGETVRNGHWVYFDKENDGVMARNKDVFLPTADDPDRWVRYGDDGAMIKGEYAVGDNWYHFDEETGAMTKGWYTLPPNDVFNYERKVCYDPTTGVMIKGVTRIDPTMTDPAQYGSLYDFDAVSGNATWHLPVAEDLTSGKFPDAPTGGYQGDRRQRVLYAALSRLGAPYELNNIPNGFVCDGLTAWAYTQGTGEIWEGLGTGDIGPADYEWDLIKNRNGIKTNLADFQPGDLIFWGTDDTLTRYPGALGDAGWPGYHAAIYYHDGLMIHSATSTGSGVHVYSAADYPLYNYLGGGSPYITETSKVALPD